MTYMYKQVLLKYVVKLTVNSGLERLGRTRSLRNLTYCHSIGLDGLRKVTTTVRITCILADIRM